MSWYRRYDPQPEIVVCKLCSSRFYEKEVKNIKQCPTCKHGGKTDEEEKASLERIKGQLDR